jgi:hypothetical protein
MWLLRARLLSETLALSEPPENLVEECGAQSLAARQRAAADAVAFWDCLNLESRLAIARGATERLRGSCNPAQATIAFSILSLACADLGEEILHRRLPQIAE